MKGILMIKCLDPKCDKDHNNDALDKSDLDKSLERQRSLQNDPEAAIIITCGGCASDAVNLIYNGFGMFVMCAKCSKAIKILHPPSTREPVVN